MFGLTPYERNDIWNPFRDFEKDFFRGFGASGRCRTDIRDEGNRYLLECEMPGFDKNDIRIDINGSTLTLCAEHKIENDEKNDAGEYIRRERSCGSYCRSFDISNIDESAIDAEYTNGILRLSLPKKEKEQPKTKRIEIK
ncbi:MAG: Hsp20/alpha crystallin family protein [Alistipes sp.]|nr:Hsp20/alpha crystallin family protein [Alistipes sp.]